jgi:hypothetical protein
VPGSTYIKYWRKSKKANIGTYIYDRNKSVVEKWKKGTSKPSAPEKKEKETPFADIFWSSQTNLRSFYKSILVMEQLSSILPSGIIQSVHEYTKKHGNLISETNNYLMYELPEAREPDIDAMSSDFGSFAESQQPIMRIFIIGLISTYDAFIYELLQLIYRVIPEKAAEIQSDFKFSEVIKHGSIEDFRTHVIGDFAENVLRDSHNDQFKRLEKILAVKTLTEFKNYPEFIEICLRRNIFAHNDGVVNQEYLDKLDAVGYLGKKPTKGHKVEANRAYILRAIDVVQETVFKLSVVAWRKIGKNDGDLESLTNEAAYRLIFDKRYRLAANLLRFMVEEQKAKVSDQYKKMMTVNWANAARLNEDKNYKNILDKEDWSASSDKYKFCVATLLEKYTDVYDLMDSVVESKAVSKMDLVQWPVFSELRKQKEFKDRFLKKFGEPVSDLMIHA